MPVDFARTAGGMVDLVSAPVNSLMQSRDNAEQNVRRNALLDEARRRTDIAEQRTQMQWGQEQQDRQKAEAHAQHVEQAKYLLPLMQQGNPLAYQAAQKMIFSAPDFPEDLRQSIAQAPPEQQKAYFDRVIGQVAGAQEAETGPRIGNYNPGDYTPASFAEFVQTKDPSRLQRYVTPAQDKVVVVNGVPTMVDPRTAQQTPLTTPEAVLTAKEQQAAAAARGTTQGKAQATSAAQLPTTLANADDMLRVLGDLKESPGLRYITGAYSMTPGGAVPGTPQADALAVWEQLQGKAFLQAFDTLKGGGQITEVEGKKATAAITRLANRQQSLGAFKKAISDLEEVVRSGQERAKAKAGQAPAAPASVRKYNPETGKIE